MPNDPFRKRFPGLFEWWTSHDLGSPRPGFGSHRPEFYRGLRREDEPLVWKFIEENYLSKYRGSVRIGFDWMADGLWETPFPGSVGMGVSVDPEHFGMPEPLAARVRAWQGALDRLEVGEENPDHEASDAEGLKVAKEVKLFLGDDYYVEFREIVIRDGGTVEFEVPAFITGLTR